MENTRLIINVLETYTGEGKERCGDRYKTKRCACWGRRIMMKSNVFTKSKNICQSSLR